MPPGKASGNLAVFYREWDNINWRDFMTELALALLQLLSKLN